MKKQVVFQDQTREVCSGWSVRICVVWGLGLGGAGDEVKEFVWGAIYERLRTRSKETEFYYMGNSH